MAEQYIYAVTRVHAHEQGLLSRQDLEQLIAMSTVQEAMTYLSDKGWGSPDIVSADPDALVAFERGRTWDLVDELVGEVTPFDVFRVANDYHNLKAAIKLAYTADDETNQERYFVDYGTVDLDVIIKAANEHEFSALPDDMAKAGKAAYEALAHTGVGQASDIVIDKAALVAIDAAGKDKKTSVLLRRYAELTVDSANIKVAVRSSVMSKSRDFIEKAIAPGGTLNTSRLISAAAEGLEAVYTYLSTTDYASAIDEIKTSLAAFERWCDNKLIDLIRPQRFNCFGIEPIAAFILGRESEIQMVRLILSAKINHFSEQSLRERLRETYV